MTQQDRDRLVVLKKVRIFPDEDACLRLTSALMMELNVEWMDRIYLDMSASRSGLRRPRLARS